MAPREWEKSTEVRGLGHKARIKGGNAIINRLRLSFVFNIRVKKSFKSRVGARER